MYNTPQFSRTYAHTHMFTQETSARPKETGSPKKSPSKCCGSCSACNFRTKVPRTDCKFGSNCTRKDCMYAHASPAGSNHMAGTIATACKEGIQCTLGSCNFAHPSKSLVCTNQDEGGPAKSHGAKVYENTCMLVSRCQKLLAMI